MNGKPRRRQLYWLPSNQSADRADQKAVRTRRRLREKPSKLKRLRLHKSVALAVRKAAETKRRSKGRGRQLVRPEHCLRESTRPNQEEILRAVQRKLVVLPKMRRQNIQPHEHSFRKPLYRFYENSRRKGPRKRCRNDKAQRKTGLSQSYEVMGDAQNPNLAGDYRTY